jgi:hypothetical protein
VAAPQYQALIAQTRTGAIVDAIDQPEWSFDEPLAWNDLGKATLSMPLPGRDRAGRITRSTLRALGNGGSSLSIVLMRDDDCLWAGPVYTLGWNAGSISVGCASLGKLLDRRVVVANGYWGNPAVPAADVTLNMSARDKVITLLSMAITGSRRNLPITLPSLDGLGGAPTDYLGGDLRTTYEAVGDIVEAQGGPDVMLVPSVSNDKSTLSWAAVVGTPRIGTTNPDSTWDYPMVIVEGDMDDSETVSTAYVPGESIGSGDTASRAIGVATFDRGDPWPALERADRTSVSETRQPQLNALAASYGEQYRYPIEELALSAPADVVPLYRDAWNLGDVGSFVVTGHPWLDDTTLTRRVVAVAANRSEVTLSTVAA